MRFTMRDQSDQDLVLKTLKGNVNQFAILIERYKNLVFSTLLAKADRIDDAEDLAQDVFLKAYRELDTLADPRKFGPWLRKISENSAINFLSSRTVRQRDLSPILELSPSEDPETEFERNERHERLHKAISQLNPQHREVILLYYFEGISSLQKVADFLELPLSTVKGRVESARDELRDKLYRELEDFARERSPGSKFTKNLMAALPVALWQTKKTIFPYGLGWKIAVSITILLGIGLLGFVDRKRIKEVAWKYLDQNTFWKKEEETHTVRFASWEERQWVTQAIASPERDEKEENKELKIGGRSPAAFLIYTGQLIRYGEYTVMGFPGSAAPGSKIGCFFSDGTEKMMAYVEEDGSFRFTVPYSRGRPGFSIRAKNAQGEWSPPMYPRLDYPLMGGMGRRANERGWVHITLASANEKEEGVAWERQAQVVSRRTEKFRQWLEENGKTAQEFSAEGLPLPDSISMPRVATPDSLLRIQEKPEDLKIYGYSPEGEKVTCIIGANGASFSADIGENGMFMFLVPHEAVEVDILDSSPLMNEKRPPAFIINVTDSENRLLASHGTGNGIPRWARVRAKEKQEQAQRDLIGRNAPGGVFRSLDEDRSIDLNSLIGQVVLINVWSAHLSKLEDISIFQRLYPELAEKNVFLLSINGDRPVDVYRREERLHRFLKKMGCTFPIYKDPHSVLAKSFFVDYMPTTMILDQEGVIQFFLNREGTIQLFKEGRAFEDVLRSELGKLTG